VLIPRFLSFLLGCLFAFLFLVDLAVMVRTTTLGSIFSDQTGAILIEAAIGSVLLGLAIRIWLES
jgi:hypothetical protein